MDVAEKVSRILGEEIPYAYMIESAPEEFNILEGEDQLGVVRECHVTPVPVCIDGKVCIAVVPTGATLHLERLRKYLGAGELRLASEQEYGPLFPDGDAGEMPLFGSRCGVRLLVPHELTDYQEITFLVGAAQVIVRIRLLDFLAMEKPDVCAEHAMLTLPNDSAVRSVKVYRIDGDARREEEVGILVERRKGERGNNFLGLLRLARKEFAEAAGDPSRIVIERCG